MKRDDLDELFEEKFAKFFGQLTKHLDERMDKMESRLDARIDGVHTSIDVVMKRLETERIERAALSHQVDRHDGWIGQLADNTSTKLVPEQ